MISLQHRFLFIHVPKTGGNAIQERLQQYSEDRIVTPHAHQDGVERFEVRSDKYPITKHSTLAQYQAVVEPELFEGLFKFATIRNPWDKLISHYFSPHRAVDMWDRAAFIESIEEVRPLRAFTVRPSLSERIRERLGRNSLPGPTRPLDADLDLIMRFEHLDDDFRRACEQISIPYAPLVRRNRSARRDYREYYDIELVEIVGRKFAEEIEFGDYQFE